MHQQFSSFERGMQRAPRVITLEAGAAYLLAFVIAFRYRLPLEISLSFVVAVIMLPVTLRVIRKYNGALTITILSIVAAVSGVLLTMNAEVSALEVNGILALQKTVGILSVAIITLALLWVRSVVGIRNLVFVFGLGSLAAALFNTAVGEEENSWKILFSIPLTLILLTLPWVYRSRIAQAAVAIGLAAFSAFADSRSAAALLFIAAALTFTQARPDKAAVRTSTRVFSTAARLAVIGVGAFFAIQAALVEGALGDAAQLRTQAQLEGSGSVFTGGRPEMGATTALVFSNPWGFGSGVSLSQTFVTIAKSGMSVIGYDPNNGYVERYMFGSGIEVHSLIGDFWLMFGLAGLALALFVGIASIYGLIVRMSLGIASTVVIFLVLHLTWDLLFSPYFSSLRWLPLSIAVALPVALVHASGGRSSTDRAAMISEGGQGTRS